MRFNTVSSMRMMPRESPNRPVAAASVPAGTGVVVPLLALAMVDFIRAGHTDVDAILRAMDPPAEQAAEVRTSVESCMTRFIPTMKTLGIF